MLITSNLRLKCGAGGNTGTLSTKAFSVLGAIIFYYIVVVIQSFQIYYSYK